MTGADRGRSRCRNGEGSIYQRQSDGKWVGAAYVLTTAGVPKRKVVYGDTWDEAYEKLTRLVARSHQGIPAPERSSRVDEFLTYWLAAYVADLRPTTARGYEAAVRLHLIPGLGGKRLDKLTVQDVRAFMTACRQKCLCCAGKLDQHRAIGKRCCSVGECCKRLPSTRQVQFIHAVLRNALGQAMREELVNRNVATLVRVPAPRYKVGKGLSVEQVKALLRAAEGHRLHPLYLVAATLGLRRGELLGLRWQDLDLDRGILSIEQTVQRVAGRLRVQDTKSEDSDGVLPLPEVTWLTLLDHQKRQKIEREAAGKNWTEHGLVFPSQLGTPMEPRNLNRHFAGLGSGPDCLTSAYMTCGTPW